MGERLKNYLKRMEQMVAAWEREELAQGEGSAPCQLAEGREEAGRENEILPGQPSPPNANTPPESQEKQLQRARQLARAKRELLTQISFFQHERLIHLIVTVLFALLSLLVLIWLTVDFRPEVAVLFLLLLVLLIPYIRHYYILENGTQKLYQYYDRLEALLGKTEFSDDFPEAGKSCK